jgi:hypothetical protein
MNTIEQMWQDAFSGKEISRPRLINLYQTKSVDILARIERRMKRDTIYLFPFALLCILVAGTYNLLWIGLYIAAICGALIFLNLQKIRDLKKMNRSNDIFSYLQEYRKKLRDLRVFYIKLLAIGTPLTVFPAYFVFFRSNENAIRFFSENSPIVSISFLLGIAAVLSGWAVFAYLFSNRLLYGRLMRRMNELIGDLEAIKEPHESNN